MVDLILLLVFNSLIIWGFWFACQFEGHEAFDLLPNDQKRVYKVRGKMIFWWVRYYWRGSDFYAKPIYLCPICMASLHGITPFFLLSGLDFFYLPFYILALSGINGAMSYKVFDD